MHQEQNLRVNNMSVSVETVEVTQHIYLYDDVSDILFSFDELFPTQFPNELSGNFWASVYN